MAMEWFLAGFYIVQSAFPERLPLAMPQFFDESGKIMALRDDYN